MDNVKIGQLILRLRKENNMTQLQLAEKMGISDKASVFCTRQINLVLHTSRLVLSGHIKTALPNEGAVLLYYVAIFSRIIARIFFSRLLTCT